MFHGVPAVARSDFGFTHISTVTGEVCPVVPKLTPVVVPKLNDEPDPAVVVEPLLFK
jgi:hypothetical protein